jgi:beta-propeller repeat-containing protein
MFDRGPLRFEPNEGQSAPQVKFLAHGPGYSVFLTSTDALFAILKPVKPKPKLKLSGKALRAWRTNPDRDKPPPVQYSLVRMKLQGAQANPSFEGMDRQSGRINYFIGNDQKKWHRNIPIYSGVKAHNVYPGIDLVYRSGADRRFEYDLVVAPSANPDAIKISFAGVDSMKLNSNGDLLLGLNGRTLIQRAPLVYQDVGGSRKPIAARYVLRDKRSTAIQLAAYDRAKPLIIDPALILWSTYFGGTVGDTVSAVAVRPNNGSDNIYLTGATISPNLAVLANPAYANLTANGGNDAYVAEVNHDGTAVIYYSYLGGHQDDFGNSIAVDLSGNAYVTGRTFSTDYPTTSGVVQESWGSVFSSGFVTEMKFDGSNLVYSTYVHGFTNNNFGSPPVNGNNAANSIAVDGVGNAYVTGWTDSLAFPTNSAAPPKPAFQTQNGGIIGGMSCQEDDCEDAFVVELNSGGTSFVFSTYLGGEEQDRGLGITVQGTRPTPTAPEVFTPFVTGFTSSTMFPVTPNAFQPALATDPNFPDSPRNSFVTEVQSDGTALISSTYLGGGFESSDVGAIAATIDTTTPQSKMVCVTGATNSPGFPVCGSGSPAIPCTRAAMPFESSAGFGFPNPSVGYVTCFNFDGNALVAPPDSLAYSTFLGGTMDSQGDEPQQAANSIQIDDCDNVYVTGYTNAADFPVSSDGYLPALTAPYPNLGGEEATNAFLTVLDYFGSGPMCSSGEVTYSPCSPIFSTYLGGSGSDQADGIVLDLNGNIIVGGQTSGSNETDDFPTTQGSLLPNYPGNGGEAGFLTKFGVLPGECKVDNCAVAVTVTNSGASSGSPGQTVPAGGFTLTNLCADAVFISNAQIILSDPGLFSSLSLTATVMGTPSTAPGTPAPTTVFTFPNTLMLVPGDVATLALSATISSSPMTPIGGQKPAITGTSHASSLLQPIVAVTNPAQSIAATKPGVVGASTISSTQNIFGSSQLNSRGHTVLNQVVPVLLGTISLGAGPTQTATSTPTATQTARPTAIATSTATSTVVATRTATATPTRTATTISTPTATATSTQAATATATATSTGGTTTATPTATATVALPPGHISVAPLSLNFPTLGIGAKPVSKPFTIKNLSRTNPLIGEITGPGGPFSLNPPPGQFVLLPGKGSKYTVTFSPLSVGTSSAQIEIDSNDPSQPEVNVDVAGTGEAGVLSAPSGVTFGPTRMGTTAKKRISLKNIGKGVLSGSIPDLGGAFSISFTGPFSLNPGRVLPVTVTFSPSFQGEVESELLIFVSPPGQPSGEVEIQLNGTGK